MNMIRALLVTSVIFLVPACGPKNKSMKHVVGSSKSRSDLGHKSVLEEDDSVSSDSVGAVDQSSGLRDPKSFPDSVFFAFDQSDLNSDGMEVVKRHINVINGVGKEAKDTLKLTIDGYCDNRGTHEYNLVLGKKRAESLKKAIHSSAKGSAVPEIQTRTFGRTDKFSSGASEKNYSQNRRAVITYSTK